jgi:hypothetical protein
MPHLPSTPPMLRKLLYQSSDELSSTEDSSLLRLGLAFNRLRKENGRIDLKSDDGSNACTLFLQELDATATILRAEVASRKYRKEFTVNYRALFPDSSRNYRVDILEASLEQFTVIWVNGSKFEFSAVAMSCATKLQQAWSDLATFLEQQRTHNSGESTKRPARSLVRKLLSSLDGAWASFEHVYVSELIAIEDKARNLIVEAIKCERALTSIEARESDDGKLLSNETYVKELTNLVKSIARLNSVANHRRKGRDDLDVNVFCEAKRTLAHCTAAHLDDFNSDTLAAAHVLSRDVVESLDAMRSYLKHVSGCLERVDPHLCNNAGLVERLVDLEESWEVGTRYVSNAGLLNSMCDIVAEIKSAQRIAPALISMCDECDVELFMVLPRIIWLRCLANPQVQTPLFESLLPHRFGHISVKPWLTHEPELSSFFELYNHTVSVLVAMLPTELAKTSMTPEQSARNILVKKMVSGPGGIEKSDIYSFVLPEFRIQAEDAVEKLAHELEKWSMELQRHCPDDWNQCSAILVRCLSENQSDSEARTQRAFRI